MKIDEFQDYLQNDLAWRKMEISQLFMIMQTSESKEIVAKSIILLLYAHWEGFIKKSSKCYIKYISDKNIKLSLLTENFEAIMLKKYAIECIENDSNNLAKEFTFLIAQKKKANRPFNVAIDIENEFDDKVIDTHHNLSSKVLKNIIQIVGIEHNEAIQTRKQYLDSNLVNNRNTIGHGSVLKNEEDIDSPIEYSRVAKLKDFVLSMLDYYSFVLMKYVEEELYLVANSEKRSEFEASQAEKLSVKLKAIEEKEIL